MRKERIVTVNVGLLDDVDGESRGTQVFLRDGATHPSLLASPHSRCFPIQVGDYLVDPGTMRVYSEGVEWKAHFDQYIKIR